jgi:hypothetical protein
VCPGRSGSVSSTRRGRKVVNSWVLSTEQARTASRLLTLSEEEFARLPGNVATAFFNDASIVVRNFRINSFLRDSSAKFSSRADGISRSMRLPYRGSEPWTFRKME